MAAPKVYVICDSNCKYEGMTKEQILTAITQAVSTGKIGDCDTGFITTVKTITGKPLKFFVGEQSEYDALSASQKQNLFAIITNDITYNGILSAVNALKESAEESTRVVNELLKGDAVVPKASHADTATDATRATNAVSAVTATYVKGIYNNIFVSASNNGEATVDLDTNSLYLIVWFGDNVSNECRHTFMLWVDESEDLTCYSNTVTTNIYDYQVRYKNGKLSLMYKDQSVIAFKAFADKSITIKIIKLLTQAD